MIIIEGKSGLRDKGGAGEGGEFFWTNKDHSNESQPSFHKTLNYSARRKLIPA